jgi:hypothetical protein
MVQLRNLNIDPDLFFDHMGKPEGEIRGIANFVEALKNTFPKLVIGSYSKPVPKK